MKIKSGLLLSVLMLAGTLTFAQTTAVTSEGDEVILNTDGTWKYSNGLSTTKLKSQTSDSVFVNPTLFKKSKDATFLIKSKKNDAGVYFDPKSWKLKKGTFNEEVEYFLYNSNLELYSMMICENIEIPLERFKEIVIANAERVSDEPVVVDKEEYRTINGLKVLYLNFRAKAKGISITYSGYYFSDDQGSTQLVCYTGQKTYQKQKTAIENFLNGLVNTAKK